MENILFAIGDVEISVGLAVAIAGALIILAFVTVLLVSLGAEGKRIEQAANRARLDAGEHYEKQIVGLEVRIRDLEIELDKYRQSNTDLEARAAGLQASMSEQQKQNEYVRSQMSGQFKLLAEEVLTSHGEKFSRQNRQQVNDLLKPLAEKIGEFQKLTHEGSARLAEQMKTLAKDSLRMSEEATNLTRALKGSSQTQGAWGELILSTILEKSGLREGEQFLTQQSHRLENGTLVRTDVEVLFPNKDRLVVDSKVSLRAFEAFTSSTDEEEKTQFLRDHITALRAHIKTLGSKDYHVHSGSGLNYVMMFIPIEAAFSTAFEAQSDLIDFAISKNVYITTPTTLMVALRTVANVWDTENRNKNAEKIAKRAGLLYDKIAGFLGSMDRVEKALFSAQKSFDEAKGQLSSGPGNVIRQVEQLGDLGAKNSKPLPSGWDREQAVGSEKGLIDKPDAQQDAIEEGTIEDVPEFLTSPDYK